MTPEEKIPKNKDQRKHHRISGSVIEYSYVQADPVRTIAFMKDLSLGGVCIYLNDELPVQTTLQLWIHHFGHETPIEAKGEVVWQRPSHFMNCFDTGIKFTELKHTEKEKLEDFIHSFTPAGARSETPDEAEDISTEGVYKQFYTTGELLSEVNVIRGKMEGVRKYYYRTGEVLEELNWLRGKRHGPRKCYYPNGKVYLEQEFNEGICVITKKFNHQGKQIRSSGQ